MGVTMLTITAALQEEYRTAHLVDEVHGRSAVKLANFVDEHGSEKVACGGKSEIAGELGIAKPFGGKLRRCFPGRAIDRVDSNHGRSNALRLDLLKRFGDKASADLIAT